MTLQYATSEEELVKGVINGGTNLVVLSEPWVSDLLNKRSDFKITVNIQDEWTKVVRKDKPLPQTCLIVKNDIASQKDEAWNMFLKDYKDSIKWVNNNQAKTAELLEHHEVGVQKELAEKVISRSNLEYFDATSAQSAVETYLNIFLETSPESIGGKLPNAAFYYEE